MSYEVILRFSKNKLGPASPAPNVDLNPGLAWPGLGLGLGPGLGPGPRAIVEKSENFQNFKSSQNGLAYSGKS